LIAKNLDTGEQFLICYSGRKSKQEGMVCLTAVPPTLSRPRIFDLAEATGTDAMSWVSTERKDSDIATSGPWRVRWSGYTQRDRRALKELPSIYKEEEAS
jgi:hypothetical protein